MKYSLIFFSLFFCEFSLAVKTVQFDSIGFGKLLNMSAMIQLPQGQKLNHAAPSRIAVYEKDAGKWNLTDDASRSELHCCRICWPVVQQHGLPCPFSLGDSWTCAVVMSELRHSADF
ncbi:MAG: hypothetical protein EOP09_13405 [Proteobacteria bacterium]|nr:MAG: hypothetical protein EOP09_13405 [Pseudomonadota bacterium]